MTGNEETIVAVSTPSGRGALALLRLSGPEAFSIAAKCLQEKPLFEKLEARYVALLTAIDPLSLKTIDQVTAIKYAAPRSYTGEDMVEVICHGGRLIVGELLIALKSAGARGAERGEFTRRALINGKIDLLKAEGIQGIIESESPADLACARKLYSGDSIEIFSRWRQELAGLLETVEAWIEFEEDGERATGKEKLDTFVKILADDLKRRADIQFIESGLKIVIAGPANAGKSTLFNRLLGFNRAIVHPTPGTTRDIVGERMMVGAHEIQLIDSAGIRVAENEVEKEGIERSREAILGSAIVIWVTPADEKMGQGEWAEIEKKRMPPILCVINKIDRGDPSEKEKILSDAGIEHIAVSLKEQDRIEEIEVALKTVVEKIHEEMEVPDIILNTRHEEIAGSLIEEMRCAGEVWERPEIAAMHLRCAVAKLDEYFGKSDPEEIINKIFEKFCIGK